MHNLRKAPKQQTAFCFRAVTAHGFRLLQPPTDAYIQLVAVPLSLLRIKCDSDVSKRLQHKLDMVSWTMKVNAMLRGLWDPRSNPIIEIGPPLWLLAVQTLTLLAVFYVCVFVCVLSSHVPLAGTSPRHHGSGKYYEVLLPTVSPRIESSTCCHVFSLEKLQVVTSWGSSKEVTTCLSTCLARLCGYLDLAC